MNNLVINFKHMIGQYELFKKEFLDDEVIHLE